MQLAPVGTRLDLQIQDLPLRRRGVELPRPKDPADQSALSPTTRSDGRPMPISER